MVDYRDEIRLGKEVLSRTVEAYRKIRNTLAQVPALESVRLRSGGRLRSIRTRLVEVDRYVLARLRAARRGGAAGLRVVRLPGDLPGRERVRDGRSERVLSRRVEGSPLHLPRRFGRAALGADGASTSSPTASRGCWRRFSRSPPMRSGDSCQERARRPCTWRCFPADTERLARCGPRSALGAAARRARGRQPALEGARQRKEIGNALSAQVVVSASGETADLLERYAADLPMLFITSGVDGAPHGARAS